MDSETKKVFNYILHKGGSMQFVELQKPPSPLAKLTEQDAEEWLVSHANLENQHFVLGRRQDGRLSSVRLYFKTRFCLKYQETGCCKTPDCKYGWHICKGYVEGNCADARKCRLLHDFHDPHNSRAISECGFEKVPDGTIRKLISRCVPQICTEYIEKKCKQPKKCPRLHVCPDFIKQSCDGDCSFSHTLEDGHNKQVLSAFGLSPHMKPIKVLLVNILVGKGVKYSVPCGAKMEAIEKQDKYEADLNMKMNNLGTGGRREMAEHGYHHRASRPSEENPELTREKGRGKHGKHQRGGGKMAGLATKPCFSDLPHGFKNLPSDEYQLGPEGQKLKEPMFMGSRLDQSGLQQQIFKPNIHNRDIPPLMGPPIGGLDSSGPFQTRGRGNFSHQHPLDRGPARGRAGRGHYPGQRPEERFEEAQTRVEEKAKSVIHGDSRGGGRGQRGRGRGRGAGTRGVARGQRSRGRGATERHDAECYQSVEEFQEVASLQPDSNVNDPERKVSNLNKPTSKKKKGRSCGRKKSNQQEVSHGDETPSSQTDEQCQLIDLSDESDEDSSALLIDLSTDLSQSQDLYNPTDMSQTDLNFEDWLGESSFSQDSSHIQSLSLCDPFDSEPLQVQVEEPSLSQAESQSLPLNSPPIVANHSPSEKAVFDVLCREYSCAARFSEILSRKDLFPPFFTDVGSWFRKYSNSFQITENESGEIDIVSAFSRTARMCLRYSGSSGSCSNKKCTYFHVCNQMVASGFCSFGVTCLMNHNLQDKRSRAIAHQLKLNNLTDDQLCALIRVSSPQVCLEYNRDVCQKDEKCEKVHICKSFVCKKCSDTGDCELMHEEALDSPHTQTILDRLKIPANKIPSHMLLRMLLVCEDPNAARAEKLLLSAPHIHDDSNVAICTQFVLGKCRKGNKCPRHHCPMPYQWQYCVTGQDEKWMSFSEETNEDLERLYCDVTNADELTVSHIRGLPDVIPRLHPGSNTIHLNLSKMNAGNDFVSVSIRRLSTESCVTSSAAMATRWVWYWLDANDSWKEYGYGLIQCESPVQQKDIESYFQHRENKFYSFSTVQHSYRLFFQEPMYQQNMNPKFYTIRNVKRRPLFCSREEVAKNKRKKSEKQKPVVRSGSWKAVPEGRDFIRVLLSPGSHEYKDVERLFCQTMSPDRSTIIKIERVQNQEMWNSYERKKTAKAEDLGNDPEERFLFHIVAENMADRFCAQNLDYSDYSSNATAFGHGVYFACQASFSDRYCGEKPGSNRFMFVASVLVGSYTTGDPSMHSAPPTAPYDDPFDSCVDDVQRPSVFVVFNKDQYYLAYLIEYSNNVTKSEEGNAGSLEAGGDTQQADSCLLM